MYACARVCPVNGIIGDIRKPHRIDPEICSDAEAVSRFVDSTL